MSEKLKTMNNKNVKNEGTGKKKVKQKEKIGRKQKERIKTN